MAFSLLWSFGLIISILIFAVAIGFCLGYAGISRKSLAIVSIGSIICTFILVYAINLFKNQLNLVMGAYNYLLLFLIAFVMMFIGYSINKNIEDNEISQRQFHCHIYVLC
jgi:predicted transporter